MPCPDLVCCQAVHHAPIGMSTTAKSSSNALPAATGDATDPAYGESSPRFHFRWEDSKPERGLGARIYWVALVGDQAK